MTDLSSDTYKTVQGLCRGLSILRSLNQAPNGWASIRELSQTTGLHRTTVRRLLETLQLEGLVRRSTSDDSYRLTLKVRELSEGFTDDEWISNVATPILGELLQSVVWPTDLLTLDGDAMIIRESTHRYSPLSFHRGMVRVRMPLLWTAAGRAYLAFCPQEEREALLDQLERAPLSDIAPAFNRADATRKLDMMRKRGFSWNYGEWRTEQKISAIAVPVFRHEKVVACINVVMLKKVVSIEAARHKYLEHLQAAARKLESYLTQDEKG